MTFKNKSGIVQLMNKIDRQKNYIEEHVFRGDIMSSFFVVTYVANALGARLKELQNEKIKFNYDQYFDHTDEIIPLPEWNAQSIMVNYHFALCVDKKFKLNKSLDDEATWFVNKLFNNTKFTQEVDSIRKKINAAQNDIAEPFKKALDSNPFLGPIVEINLNKYEIDLKCGGLIMLAYPQVVPLMKKFNIPEEYMYFIMQVLLSGIEIVKENMKDWFDLSYLNYYGGIVYMIHEPQTDVKYIQKLIVKPPSVVYDNRNSPIISYFQKHFFTKRSKPLKSAKYSNFIKLFELDNSKKHMSDLEKGKIIYGDCGKNKAKNISKLRGEMEADMRK